MLHTHVYDFPVCSLILNIKKQLRYFKDFRGCENSIRKMDEHNGSLSPISIYKYRTWLRQTIVVAISKTMSIIIQKQFIVPANATLPERARACFFWRTSNPSPDMKKCGFRFINSRMRLIPELYSNDSHTSPLSRRSQWMCTWRATGVRSYHLTPTEMSLI